MKKKKKKEEVDPGDKIVSGQLWKHGINIYSIYEWQNNQNGQIGKMYRSVEMDKKDIEKHMVYIGNSFDRLFVNVKNVDDSTSMVTFEVVESSSKDYEKHIGCIHKLPIADFIRCYNNL